LMDMDFAVKRPLVRRRMPLSGSCPSGRDCGSPLLSDPASRRRPCGSLALHLHQVVQGTCTPRLSNMLGTRYFRIWPSARWRIPTTNVDRKRFSHIPRGIHSPGTRDRHPQSNRAEMGISAQPVLLRRLFSCKIPATVVSDVLVMSNGLPVAHGAVVNLTGDVDRRVVRCHNFPAGEAGRVGV